MKEEPNNKCKELELFHLWRDITSNFVYATMPPQHPPKQERCVNCGLVRTYREKRETWFDYEITEVKPPEETIILNGNSLTGTGGINLTNKTLPI